MPPPARSAPPSPPARGSFPLDHNGECKPYMQSFLKCMRDQELSHSNCRTFSKDYLQCRMNHGLMANEDLDSLGFSPDVRIVPAAPENGSKQPKEIIAGLSAAKKPGGFFMGLSSQGSSRGGGGHG
jgi:cytochrome c oxidase assembly protein subunit 19